MKKLPKKQVEADIQQTARAYEELCRAIWDSLLAQLVRRTGADEDELREQFGAIT